MLELTFWNSFFLQGYLAQPRYKRVGPWSCLKGMCQTLLTLLGKPYPLHRKAGGLGWVEGGMSRRETGSGSWGRYVKCEKILLKINLILKVLKYKNRKKYYL